MSTGAFRNISHIAIGVRDLATSMVFYRDILGLTLVRQMEKTFVAGATSSENPPRKSAYFRWSSEDNAGFLVLDQQLQGLAQGGPSRIGDLGIHHVGFWVSDVDVVVGRARSHGVRLLGEPVIGDTLAYAESAGGKVKAALLLDPDGNVIQLDERVSS